MKSVLVALFEWAWIKNFNKWMDCLEETTNNSSLLSLPLISEVLFQYFDNCVIERHFHSLPSWLAWLSSRNVIIPSTWLILLFWWHSILCDQVAVAALFFEVQRSARSEAKKEEARRREMEVNILWISAYFICALSFCYLDYIWCSFSTFL